MPYSGDKIFHGHRVLTSGLSKQLKSNRDFPTTAISIARQCGIIRNSRVDDIRDLLPHAPFVKEYDPDDRNRIGKSIALTGKDLPQMTDSQWHQVRKLRPDAN
jgi:magnesium-transporting ATPase (P-type)